MNAPTAFEALGGVGLTADNPGTADLERRFGGLRRLYGAAGYAKLRAARVAVVGLGGVGSWAAEALARSGVALLVLIDLDHVAESNINRQVQAVGASIGQAKGQALKSRIADIHPGCDVRVVEEFVQADNWPALLPVQVDVLIDACDQVHAKLALALWGRSAAVPVVCVGAAGGKRLPQAVEVADLGAVTHDPLLASLRQRLRKQLRAEAQPQPTHSAALGLCCVFSREAVTAPQLGCETAPVAGAGVDGGAGHVPGGTTDGSLNCHGYGSSVTVTASFGMVAAAQAINGLLLQTCEPSLQPALGP